MKYGNKKTEFKGILYDSKGEAYYAQSLDSAKRGKGIKDWQRQVKFDILVNGKHICNYISDFVVTNMDGSKEIHECKGYFTSTARLKMKLMEAIYGKEYKLVLIQL